MSRRVESARRVAARTDARRCTDRHITENNSTADAIFALVATIFFLLFPMFICFGRYEGWW